MRPDIVPGAVFPDYELPHQTGTPRKLSELQGEDPLILTLARGHYFPKEHSLGNSLHSLMLGAIQKNIFSWHMGFWGDKTYGWHDDLMFILMNLVIVSTDGGQLR